MQAIAERPSVTPTPTEDEDVREDAPTAPIAGAATSSALQGAFGNVVVLDALRGAGSALHEAVREGLSAAVAGNGAPTWAQSNQEAIRAAGGGLPGWSQPAAAKQAAAMASLDEIAAGLGAEGWLSEGIGREPDGFVDHYMEVNWDDRAFHALARQVGYPSEGPAGAWSAIDRFLPEGVDPTARAGIQLACRIATGALDEVIVHRLAEEMGRPGEVLLTLRLLGTTIAPYVELEDPVGLAILGGCALLDGVAEAFGDLLDEMTAGIADIVLGIAVVTQVPAVVSLVAGPEGPAAVEAAGASAAATLEAVRFPLQATSAVVRGWQATLALAQTAWLEYRAQEEQIAREFGRAAVYRKLIRDRTLDVLHQELRALMALAFTIPGFGAIGTTAFKSTTKVVLGGAKKAGGLLGGEAASGPDLGGVAVGALMDTASAQAALPALGDLPFQPDGSDAMLRSFAFRAHEGREGDRVDAARARLQADPPSWYQHLVNGIAGQNERTFDELVSPTAWIGELMHAVPELAGVVANATPEAVALGCDLLAGVADAHLPALIERLDGAVAEWKPKLDEIVVAIDEHVQAQELSLVHLQAAAASLRGTIEAFHAGDAPLDGLLATSEAAIGQLRACRVDPARLGLPPTIPPALVAGMVEPVNAAVDQAVEALEVARDAALADARETAMGLLSALEARAEWLDGAIAEGGEIAVALRAQHATAQDLVHRAAEAFVAWEAAPAIDPAAVSGFLRDVAAACRAVPPVEEVDPWPGLLATIAQPSVDRWRAAHAEDVEVLFGHEAEAGQGAASKFSGSERSFRRRPGPEIARSETGNAGCKPQTSRSGVEAA